MLSTDHFCWSGPGWGTKEGYDLVHEILGSHAESLDIDVLDLDHTQLGTFDVVLMLGVFYHMPDPIRGVEIAASLSHDLLILETTYEDLPEDRALMELRPERLTEDSTNFWSPNIKCLFELLKIQGFKDINIEKEPGNRAICFCRK